MTSKEQLTVRDQLRSITYGLAVSAYNSDQPSLVDYAEEAIAQIEKLLQSARIEELRNLDFSAMGINSDVEPWAEEWVNNRIKELEAHLKEKQ